jgi:3-oxoacyl-[acyl-carrier protein] reductase
MSANPPVTDQSPVALVTGSAAGLGAAIAQGLSAEGYRIVINCTKSFKEAEAVKAAIEAQGGIAIIAAGDVSEDTNCRAIAAAARAAFGRIDVLVNNAGTTKFADHADMDALESDDFVSIYRTNVIAAYQMIRACKEDLGAHGQGSVVNVSSIAGVAGIGSSVAYAASKGAMNTMTLSLARALAPKIRVNAICPGFIGTRWFKDRMDEAQFDAVVARMEKTTPLAQAGTPEMVADAAIFFATPKSRHITGEMLLVDAGMHLNFVPAKGR